MVAVKGSKQHQMKIVPYRPWYRAGFVCMAIVAVSAAGWLIYEYGMQQGLDLRAEVIEDRSRLKRQLEEREHQIDDMRQQIAHLRVGGEIDARATVEVRQTVESLQAQIAELEEEIQFYKGVMLPNVEEKGLRIERFSLTATGEPRQVRYELLLTQIVEDHEMIQGGVTINVAGTQNGNERMLSLAEVSTGEKDTIGFKFRYFENIDGVLTVPEGFEPGEVMITAESSGRNSRKRERSFQWEPSGG